MRKIDSKKVKKKITISLDKLYQMEIE